MDRAKENPINSHVESAGHKCPLVNLDLADGTRHGPVELDLQPVVFPVGRDEDAVMVGRRVVNRLDGRIYIDPVDVRVDRAAVG